MPGEHPPDDVGESARLWSVGVVEARSVEVLRVRRFAGHYRYSLDLVITLRVMIREGM
jgi:hypothetical protein